MVMAVAWLSLFTPACMAMGVVHAPSSVSSTCDCGLDANACLAHACAQLAGSTAYVAAKAVMAEPPNSQAAPAPALNWTAAIRHAAARLVASCSDPFHKYPLLCVPEIAIPRGSACPVV